jgi:chromate transporter
VVSEAQPVVPPSPAAQRQALREVGALFFQLGWIAFGGPAAHIALMRREVVIRRKWLTEQQFLDLLGASNLIPGPTSTELAIYLGYARAGRLGLVLAGALFILPAMLLVLMLAWAYGRYGSTPQVGAILHGIKPVIIAVIVQAIYALLPTAVKTWRLGLVVALSAALYLLGFNPLIPLFGLSILVMLAENRARLARTAGKGRMVLAVPLTAAAAPVAVGAVGFSLVVLFLTFLKIGATLYGSGYVLLAFLRDDFVHRLGWLTDRQLLDAIAVGQFTPGPVFTTATFIGYLTGAGWGGSSLRWVSSCPRSSLGQQSIPLCRACERRRGRRPFWMGQMPPRSASWWQWLGNSRGAASLIRSPPS